jgi:tmRNA-binding protein
MEGNKKRGMFVFIKRVHVGNIAVERMKKESTTKKGLTLIALSLYFKRGRVKCEIGVARGRRSFDKRAAKADADNQRKLQQAMRGGIRRQGEVS